MKKDLPIDRPFDPKVLERASDVANQYRILLEPDADAGFIGRAMEMPECLGLGKTPDQCVADTRDVIVSALATMLEMGEPLPAPAAQNLRQEQINIRVTTEEKLLLEDAAQRKGFRGISDFVRTSALGSVR